ncbi:large subunit ribosomal protein L1 [Maridesulfovibrio ferrireducens]|uniref:Large ribosomal subunit protein uL1 n=1 Tax=Maridesulfovibrio ferrireducens TaxID=246191 RepID=A0A1G9F837_9BACT|nr:50S ribosomal protein L1 [Maridesulfovibrio ferrireducens]SDK84530.1 large subunit ribosomal protein L1 [Maridesulfovibrio ferrireducens]
MPKHGKNYRNATEGTDSYGLTVENAVKLAVEKAYAKFDETVDVAINLGVDPKYSDQMIRGAVTLPNGLGKEVRVACFCSGEKEAEAKAAGADFVGGEDLVAKVKDGWLDFDKAIATPDMMAKVGLIGRVLGPRGLMPNAKTGTVTFDVAKAVSEVKAGRVEFKVDKAGVLHAPIGKVSFGAEKLLENLKSLLDTVNKLKPSTVKGTYMKAVAVATTMGPGFRVDPLAARKYVES